MKKVSMQDIADAVGVARSTVSFVLNGKEKERRIGEEVANRIKETARAMNYQFNEVARSLRTGETHTIALIVADISDSFFGSLAYHVQEYAMERGYVVNIFNTSEKESSLKPILEVLKNRQLDGIIMTPIANLKQEYIEDFNLQAPVVLIDRYFAEMTTNCVTIDNYKAAQDATNFLLEKGCRNVALIAYKDSLMHMRERKRGYEETMKKNGLYNPEFVCEVEYSNFEYALHRFLSAKTKGPDRIDGLFISTGGLSEKAMKCLYRLGVAVPDDLIVIGFDRSIHVGANKPIPYVRQPMERMSQCAIDILLNQIKNKSQETIDCRLQATIMED